MKPRGANIEFLFLLCLTTWNDPVQSLLDLDSHLLDFTKSKWGTLHVAGNFEGYAKEHSASCRYYDIENKHPASQILKCNRGSSCFNTVYLTYNNGSFQFKTLNQGCWPDFLASKVTDNCSSSLCVFESLNTISKMLESNQTGQGLSAFCCCTGPYCNTQFRFDNVDQVTATPVSVLPSIKTKQPQSSTSTLILTMVISSVTLAFLIACLAVLYCWRQKQKSNINTPHLSKVMYDRKSIDLKVNDVTISAETLGNILHGNLIYQGCHSAIRLGHFGGNTVAVKVFPPRSKKQWQNEKEIYHILGDHPNIAQLFVTCNPIEDSFDGILVMSYYKEGSLLNYLRQHTLTWKNMVRLAYSITNGLAYLHGETNDRNDCKGRPDIAHLDLNSRNILVKSDGTCVLADFGFALSLTGKAPENFPAIGSIRYMAPEVLDGSIVLSHWTSAMKQVDSYALGLVLWEIVRRCHEIYQPDVVMPECALPYEKELGHRPSLQRVKQHVSIKKLRPKFPTEWKSKDFVVSCLSLMIQECWDQDGDARLTPLSVLNRLTQIQDKSSAEQHFYKETFDQNTDLFMNDNIEYLPEPPNVFFMNSDHIINSDEPSRSLLSNTSDIEEV